MTWGMMYVLHGLAGVGLIALIMMHVYFGLRPEKRDITKSMIFGGMDRDFYLKEHDGRNFRATFLAPRANYMLRSNVRFSPPNSFIGLWTCVAKEGENALLRCVEMLDRAPHAVTLAISFRRLNRIVVGRRGLEPVHTHAENRGRMGRVQPNR